ncbi:MAG: hypothetical protein AMXMBFR37_15230 [Steroidobacteraceae bacterium]
MKFIEHILEPKRLLLVWQGPEGSSRLRHTVAELVRQNDGQVRFRYLTDTSDFREAREEGFVSFPAFRKIDQTYDLGVVDTFSRRLPPRTRGDYARYLEQFRLRPESVVSDFALLAYTGAKLPSDGFSIIDPLEDVSRAGELLIEVAGFRHASEISLGALPFGDDVRFVPEPDNPRDPDAVAVMVRDQKIGYVPRQQARAVRALSGAGLLRAHIERVNGSAERPLVFVFMEVHPSAKAELLATQAR